MPRPCWAADPCEVALTGATTDGVNTVLGGLDLGPGDEVLTSDEEHPGLLAPLASARERRGVSSERRAVRRDRRRGGSRDAADRLLARVVADGRVVDTGALAAAAAPVLLDGAQGLGAIPVDVRALGCEYYAASGQKWLCGPNGSGYLYVRWDRIEDLSPVTPGYQTLADAQRALELELQARARRASTPAFPASHQTAWALAALDVLEAPEWSRARPRARAREPAGRASSRAAA